MPEKEAANPLLLCCQTRARDIIWINPFYVIMVENSTRPGDNTGYLVTMVNGSERFLVHPSRDEFIKHINTYGG